MIIGFGQFIERRSPLPSFDVLYRSARDAVSMSGLQFEEIDGFVFSSPTGTIEGPLRTMVANQVADYLGLRGSKYMDVVDLGGASFNAMLYRAMRAVSGGLAENILVVGGGKGTLRRKDSKSGSVYERNYATPIPVREFLPLSDYALISNAYNHKYGETDKGRAMIAVRERENANRNPDAVFKGYLSLDDVLGSPMVSRPLHLLECASPSDGSTSFVVSKRAIHNSPEITVRSYAEAHDPRPLSEREDITVIPARSSISRAREVGGVSNSDIDLFMFYDAFTTMVMLELESAGLAEEGKGWKFAESNSFGHGGDVPINTNGGTLNMTQPSFMSGGVILYEALLQLSGRAKGRQVKDARMALVNAIGGIMNHSTTLILEG